MKRTMEDRLLALEPKERARLALKLIESLDELTEPEWTELWVDEALRRNEEMDSGVDPGRSAAEVFAEIEAHLGSRETEV